MVPEIYRENGVEVRDLVATYIKVIVEAIKEVDEISRSEVVERVGGASDRNLGKCIWQWKNKQSVRKTEQSASGEATVE